MLFISKLLAAVLNPAIIILMAAELLLACASVPRLLASRRELGTLTGVKRKLESRRRSPSRRITDVVSITTEEDWESYVRFRETYRRRLKLYDIFASAVQLFTLLGILGTVAGLYIALSSAEGSARDITYEGIGFALSSTILGIIGAVVFKTVDMFTVTLILNPIEDTLDLFEKDYGVKNDSIKGEEAREAGE